MIVTGAANKKQLACIIHKNKRSFIVNFFSMSDHSDIKTLFYHEEHKAHEDKKSFFIFNRIIRSFFFVFFVNFVVMNYPG